ncbi:hypothetical protein MMO38_03340 [Acinetobacter sp. NIPH 1852]|uniref:hypothetical protein n=1 Tax=Acinetobacter sp. NIPH 1852 TaxID=2923428 RepID=UPI001F4B8007|nr:hypothetical protein [Acinetobacter sp. NIPH 1852]MCH7307176.1 hypothetical protein [Acinetobacter sp. NIPH 1852]
MLSEIKFFLFIVGVLFFTGCSSIERESCVNIFNNRVAVLTQDIKVVNSINLIDKNIFCGNQLSSDFYNNLDTFLFGLNNNQQKTFYTTLLLAEFHRNYNAGEFVDFLLGNKINIFDQYIEIINDQELLSKMKYTDEELQNLKILGEILKGID